MSNKILVVYNTCGLSGKENVDWYVKCIRSILNQEFEGFKVVVSSCCNTLQTRSAIQKEFGGSVAINCIDAKLPVNMTFNSTVRESIKRFGKFHSYLYVDSGIDFGEDRKVLTDIWERASRDEIGVVTVSASNDNGFNEWFGSGDPITGKDFTVPIGKACNCHTQTFSHKIYEAFEGRIIPDVFAAYCTESVTSFLSAAVDQDWVVMADKILYHLKGAHGVDGASLGFNHIGKFGEPWNNLITGKDIREILNDPEAWNSGFGYEECNNIFNHNSEAYVGNRCKDPERLRKFINDNMFIGKNQFDYDLLPALFVTT